MPPTTAPGMLQSPSDHDGRKREQPEGAERERHVALLVGEDDPGHEGEQGADPPGDQRDAETLTPERIAASLCVAAARIWRPMFVNLKKIANARTHAAETPIVIRSSDETRMP